MKKGFSAKLMSVLLSGVMMLAACKGTDSPESKEEKDSTPKAQDSSSVESKDDESKEDESKPENSETKDPNSESGELKMNEMPITTEDITISYYCGISAGGRQIYSDMSEMDLVKAMEEETGLNLEFVHPPEQDADTFFTSMIGSGEIPDIIQNDFASYPGGALGAMDDGLILDATPLIKEHAYYFMNLLEERGEEVMKNSLSDDGRFLRFGTVFLCPLLEDIAHGGFVARKDILDKHGMALPETIEEYEAMFDVFLEEGLTPWTVSLKEWQFNSYSPVATAFGVSANTFQIEEDGSIAYSRVKPEYQKFLEVMARWYEKGYINSNALTQTASDAQKEFQSGKAGAVLGGSWEVTNLEAVGQASTPELLVTGLAYPRVNKGDEIHEFNAILHSPEGRRAFINADCEHKVEAVRFVDYLYKPETLKMTAWGINTDEYTLWEEDADGKRSWTEWMTDNDEFDYETGRQRYTANVLQGMWDEEMENIQYGVPQVQQAWSVWRPNTDDRDMILGFVTMTMEESREYNQIMETINTLADEEMFKFISGQRPVEEYPSFVEQIQGMNIKRAEEIWKAAYDRYVAR